MGEPQDPALYFRHRKTGAMAFRKETVVRQRRVGLNEIAEISQSGEVTPRDRHPPSETELSEIVNWWSEMQRRTGAGHASDAERLIIELNHFTDWLQHQAGDDEVRAISERLLTAMLDTRQVLVRRLSKMVPDSSK